MPETLHYDIIIITSSVFGSLYGVKRQLSMITLIQNNDDMLNVVRVLFRPNFIRIQLYDMCLKCQESYN